MAAPLLVCGGPDNDVESCPLRLSDGRLMAVIGRNPDWASGDLYLTTSADQGQTWKSPRPIITDIGDQATFSVVRLPGDTLRLWYASNETGAYRVYSAYSVDDTTWTKEGQVDLGWGPAVTYYDPHVILEPDSSLTIITRVNAAAGVAAGAYAAHRPRGGAWDTLRRPVNAAAFRPRICRRQDGTYLAAFHRKSGPGSTNYDVFVRRSADLTAWSDSVRLTANLNSHDPCCGVLPDGRYVVYYAKIVSGAYNLCRRASADGIAWEAEEQLTFDSVHNTQPHFFTEPGGLFLTWTRAVDYDIDNDIWFEMTPLSGTTTEPQAPMASGRPFRAYPNPCRAGNLLTVELPGRRDGPASIGIYDATGRLVGDTELEGRQSKAALGTKGLPSGLYFILLRAGQAGKCERILILR